MAKGDTSESNNEQVCSLSNDEHLKVCEDLHDSFKSLQGKYFVLKKNYAPLENTFITFIVELYTLNKNNIELENKRIIIESDNSKKNFYLVGK